MEAENGEKNSSFNDRVGVVGAWKGEGVNFLWIKFVQRRPELNSLLFCSLKARLNTDSNLAHFFHIYRNNTGPAKYKR